MEATTKPLIPSFTFGDRMAKARKVAGLSSQRMAEMLDVTPTTISNWEHDHTKPATLYVKTWADITAVPLAWLLGDEDDTVTLGYRHELGLNGMGYMHHEIPGQQALAA